MACLIGAFWGAKRVLGAGIVDDTYIFLRYAENLAGGDGLVFNPGDRVEGYTSPLWVLILGLLGKLEFDLVTTSQLLSAFFGVLVILSLHRFGRAYVSRDSAPVVAVVALALAVNPSFVYWTWSGMDTALFAFLFGVAFFAFVAQVDKKGTMFLSGTCLLVAAFARLDVLAVLPVYLAYILFLNWHQKELIWRKCLSFVGPLSLLSLHFLWRYFYYGSLLPNTYYAKAGLPSAALIKHGLLYTVKFVLAFNLYWGALLLVVVLLAKRYSLTRLGLPVALVVTWAAYVTYVGGDHFAMFRFFVPILPLLAVLFLGVAEKLMEPIPKLTGWRGAGALIVLAGMLVALNFSMYSFYGGGWARYEVRMARAWRNVGLWLRDNVPPDATIACVTVGAIPYFSGLKTYDLLGLTDRTIARYGNTYLGGAVGHQKYDTDYILTRQPDYIIYMESGRTERPRSNMAESLDTRFEFSLYHLVNDPRTKELYEFKSFEMADGKYIELLRLKGRARD